MNQNIRQRVVGIIVLLLAAVILLPVILDGGGVEQRDLQRRIPPEPATPAIPDTSPERPVIAADNADIAIPEPEPEPEPVEPSGPVEPDPEVDRPETNDIEPGETADPAITESPSQPGLDERGLPEAWSVQLGAFSNQTNVENLVGRLLDAGHPAYTRRLNSSQGELTGVFVGPKVDQATARNVQQELERDFELSGRVVRYQIEEQ